MAMASVLACSLSAVVKHSFWRAISENLREELAKALPSLAQSASQKIFGTEKLEGAGKHVTASVTPPSARIAAHA
jgi:hypothetical protein